MPLELSSQQRDEVLRLIDERGLLDAIAFVRRVTGADLREAAPFVQTLARDTGRIREPAVGELSGEILGVGLFHRELIPFLGYGDSFYEKTREGTPLLEQIVDVYKDTRELYALAECLGVDPWDFNTHAIDSQRIRYEALEALLDSGTGSGPSYTDTFKALLAAGFQLYFHLRAGYTPPHCPPPAPLIDPEDGKPTPAILTILEKSEHGVRPPGRQT